MFLILVCHLKATLCMLNQCEKFEISDYYSQISLDRISPQKVDFQKLRIFLVRKIKRLEIT